MHEVCANDSVTGMNVKGKYFEIYSCFSWLMEGPSDAAVCSVSAGANMCYRKAMKPQAVAMTSGCI